MFKVGTGFFYRLLLGLRRLRCVVRVVPRRCDSGVACVAQNKQHTTYGTGMELLVYWDGVQFPDAPC